MSVTATEPEHEPHGHEHEHGHGPGDDHGDHRHGRARHLAPGVIALTALIAPVALVGILFSAGDADSGGYQCPLREATGIPCPACGATRAFFHLANGDTAFLSYNWAWPVMWLLAIGWAVVVIRRGWKREPLLGERIRATWNGMETWSMKRTVATPFILLAPAWIVALANINHINSG
jgi:Protein of unknown function (DUF2752)